MMRHNAHLMMLMFGVDCSVASSSFRFFHGHLQQKNDVFTPEHIQMHSPDTATRYPGQYDLEVLEQRELGGACTWTPVILRQEPPGQGCQQTGVNIPQVVPPPSQGSQPRDQKSNRYRQRLIPQVGEAEQPEYLGAEDIKSIHSLNGLKSTSSIPTVKGRIKKYDQYFSIICICNGSVILIPL